MKKTYACITFCSLLALHGCFQNDDNKTKANTDTSKASVQMQNGNSEDKK
ncbi:MAG: hypothetical protein ACRYF9_10215 [Janthinobacterium lividum]|nr:MULTISPECIES: hypothetical protein [Pseudomonas]